ncbi:MAG: ATP-binding protein [Planctomycetes bacterium]|nr:ATP-binding protein [Planctomycetota bacterium]
MIARRLQPRILEQLQSTQKVLVILGPRQVGKTTLLEWLRSRIEGKHLLLNGDFLDDRRLLLPERSSLSRLTSGLDYLFIDEAQNFEKIGSCLKLLHDHFPRVRVVATGSSSFDLSARTGEPLTGRQICHVLYPIAWSELDVGPTTAAVHLDHALIYGSYPEVLTLESHDQKVRLLRELAADYLLKDIFAQVDVNRSKLVAILQLLAFQIGSEVSLSEVGRQVQMDVKTVSRYLHFLSEAFVVIRLGGFSRNLRKEVTKSQKIYFVDLGLRNALVQAFQPIPLRDDLGRLFENLMVIERLKRNAYEGTHANLYFWRTYDRQELDLVEEREGVLRAFEFKHGGGKARIPKAWRESYPESEARTITRDQVAEFLAQEPRGRGRPPAG